MSSAAAAALPLTRWRPCALCASSLGERALATQQTLVDALSHRPTAVAKNPSGIYGRQLLRGAALWPACAALRPARASGAITKGVSFSTVEPIAGRLLSFCSGFQNVHQVEPRGRRLVLSMWYRRP